MSSRNEYGIAIYADGASVADMIEARRRGVADGFTTNPTLMAKAGVPDYRAFAKEVLAAIPADRSVIADEFDGWGRQAREIASWEHVFVGCRSATRRAIVDPLVRSCPAEIEGNVTRC